MNLNRFHKERSVLAPANVFLILGLLIGGLYCVFIPYGAGFDEEQHLVRIYDISGFEFVPNIQNFITLEEFFDLSYQRRLSQFPAFDMYSRESLLRKLSRQQDSYHYGFKMRSFYTPVVYLPQAIAARILWRFFDFPILPSVMIQRFIGLLVYLAGSYVAIRLIPFGKWVLMALALSPMALFQAATLNADGFTNAVSFAFIACVLHVYADQREKTSSQWILVLVGCSLMLGFAKPGTIILLLLLLILSKDRFPSKKNWRTVLVLGATLAIIINAGWIAIVLPNSVLSEGQTLSVSHQLRLIFASPVDFFVIYLQGIFLSLLPYFKDWVAAYGYWAGVVPVPVYWFYVLSLQSALLAEPQRNTIPANVCVFMIGLFLLSSAVIMGMYLALVYIPGDVSPLGRQGRYFIPFTPLLLIALTGFISVRENWQRILQWGTIGSVLIVIGYYSFGMFTTYYTYCNYPAYAGNKCILPIYKNLDKENAFDVRINNELSLSQTFSSHCNEMESVQVLVKSIPQNKAGTLRFSLLDEENQIIASRSLKTSEISAGDYLTLLLETRRGLKGATYEIRLESLDLMAPEGIGVAVSLGVFYDGTLLVSGRERHGSLIIHYVCARP